MSDLKVVPVASTAVNFLNIRESGYQIRDDGGVVMHAAPIDELHEAAGRNCYRSFSRPNPNTAKNGDYLTNIITSQHFSVLEHGSVTFYVEGVSRCLLTELERHRHLSFSVQSQRYVDESEANFVVHPTLEEHPDLAVLATDLHEQALKGYQTLYERLSARGVPRKQAREAARTVLPGGTETKFFVTGNIRTWREIIQKRSDPGADREIQQFADEIRKHLRRLAPNSTWDL